MMDEALERGLGKWAVETTCAEIGSLLMSAKELDASMMEEFVNAILKARRVFVTGAGRSLLVARSFAMRLAQLRFTAYVVGDVTTPAIGEGDALVAVSSSGSTSVTAAVAQKAKTHGATIISLTRDPNSPLAKLSNVTVKLPPPIGVRTYFEEYALTELAGSLTEALVWLTLDGITASLMAARGQRLKDIMENHANLE